MIDVFYLGGGEVGEELVTEVLEVDFDLDFGIHIRLFHSVDGVG